MRRISLVGLAGVCVVLACGVAWLANRDPVRDLDESALDREARAEVSTSLSRASVEAGAESRLDDPSREAIAPPTAAVHATETPVDEVTLWEREIVGLRAADLDGRAAELFEQVGRESIVRLQELVETGPYEVVGRGQRHKTSLRADPNDPSVHVYDPNEIAMNVIPGTGQPDGEQRKYTLPRDRYPELYALKRKANWLRERASGLRLAESQRSR